MGGGGEVGGVGLVGIGGWGRLVGWWAWLVGVGLVGGVGWLVGGRGWLGLVDWFKRFGGCFVGFVVDV